ncbi:MAG: glycosyltransferase family 2 protein [Anaerolineales bacterium]|nr:glycosyltransferase family 2 protein [Anaerolineales bacterium]
MTDWQPSIIIVTYNGLAYLPDCLSSVLGESQAYAGSEVVVVDNASSDGGADWIAEHYSQVRLLRNAHNLGFAAASNQGAAAASGDMLVFLNQDTRVLPGWLRGLLDGLSKNDGIGLTTSQLRLMSEPEKINVCGQDTHFCGLSFSRGFWESPDQHTLPVDVGAVAGSSFAILRETWRELGGFDDKLFMYYEETDLSWRARLAGYKSLYVPSSVVYHDYQPKLSLNAFYYSVRNRSILILKHWKLPTLIFIAPSILLCEAVELGYACLYGQKSLVAKLKAYGWLIKNWPGILKRRQVVQQNRKKPDRVLMDACIPNLLPRVKAGGLLGRMIIGLANAFLGLNYYLVLTFLRWFKL